MSTAKLTKYSYALLVFLLAAGLIFGSVPRLRASFNHSTIDANFEALSDKQPIDTAKLPSLIDTAEQSLNLWTQPHYWQDLSRLLLIQADTLPPLNPERQVILRHARYSIKQSLAMSPANSLLWFQLARTDFLLNEVTQKTIQALNLSMMTGPYQMGHIQYRLQLCLKLLAKFAPEDHPLIQSQILAVWKVYPRQFIQIIALTDNNLQKIRRLLHDKSPDILAAMEAQIEKHP